MTPKSILKKTSRYADSHDEETPSERARRVAVQQAKLIQQQKEVEAQIFDAILTLLDYPSGADGQADAPSEVEIENFKALIKPFQPSDYDTLIEERRIAERCGYVFCSNPPKRQNTYATYRILSSGRNFRVVEREKLEQFCSPDCAKRALYIKVQLNEEPAWIRRGAVSTEIKLLDTCQSTGVDPTAELLGQASK